MTKQLELGQLVLCTVTHIAGTTVFVRIDDYNSEGSISFMEIAPGRIRNIREYAFPGKKIVCKVLEIKQNHIELSFRRVKVNERNDFNDRYKREKSYSAMLRTILGDKSREIIKQIRNKEPSLFEFLENAKEDSSILEKYVPKESAQKISLIIKEKKVKIAEVSRKFLLSSKASNGITLVKNIISTAAKEAGVSEKSSEINYIAAGKYLMKVKASDLKQADTQIRKTLENIEKSAKKNSCIFNEEK